MPAFGRHLILSMKPLCQFQSRISFSSAKVPGVHTAYTKPRLAVQAAARGMIARPVLPSRSRVATQALDDTNFAVSLLSSAAAATVVAGVTLATREDRDAELERLQAFETWSIAPIGAAVLFDSIAHSLPGLNILFSLLTEPIGAAAGVAYMMTLVLSSSQVDPKTLAPEGTVLNAQKANDSRASLRVPFTQIIPTGLKVVDFKNEASSGAGWTIGENGLPKLPINSVLIVLGVGGVILEAASHAPVLSAFMPRVLTLAAWLAVAGYGIDALGLEKKNA